MIRPERYFSTAAAQPSAAAPATPEAAAQPTAAATVAIPATPATAPALITSTPALPAADPANTDPANTDPQAAFPAPYPLIGPADSLRALSPEAVVGCRDTTQTSVAACRDTTPTAIFGAHSVVVVPPRQPSPPAASLTGNVVFQGSVLLLAATYAMLLYRNPGDVRSLLGRFSRDTISGKRLTETPGSSGFLRFLNITTAIGMLLMGVAAVKYADWLMPRALSEALPPGTVPALSLLATLAAILLVIFQQLVMHSAGALTLSQPFVAQLFLLKRVYFSLAVVVAAPPLLLLALCPRGSGEVLFFIVAAELLFTAILYLWEALRLFISKKISILHWFLYLCTVEIFPISLLWLLAAR